MWEDSYAKVAQVRGQMCVQPYVEALCTSTAPAEPQPQSRRRPELWLNVAQKSGRNRCGEGSSHGPFGGPSLRRQEIGPLWGPPMPFGTKHTHAPPKVAHVWCVVWRMCCGAGG